MHAIITYALKFGAGKIEAKIDWSYDTKPKPGDFSMVLLLYFLFPTSTGLINIIFFHYNFPMNIQKHPLIFLFMPFCISTIINAKKISKFEREVKSNGNTLLPRRTFTRFFLWKFRNILYYFFLCPFSISRRVNAEKISKFKREVKSNGNTILPRRIIFFFH